MTTMTLEQTRPLGITELALEEIDAIVGGMSTAEKLSGTATLLAGGSLLAGGPTNPIGAGLLAAAGTTEMLAVVATIFD